MTGMRHKVALGVFAVAASAVGTLIAYALIGLFR